MAKPRVLIPLGTGFEELEAIAAIDVLRRAGCQVVTASVGASNPIVGRGRIRVLADLDLSDALMEWEEDWDLVVLPGGEAGVEALRADQRLMNLVAARISTGRPVAANARYTLDSPHVILCPGPAGAVDWALSCVDSLLGEDVATRTRAEIGA